MNFPLVTWMGEGLVALTGTRRSRGEVRRWFAIVLLLMGFRAGIVGAQTPLILPASDDSSPTAALMPSVRPHEPLAAVSPPSSTLPDLAPPIINSAPTVDPNVLTATDPSSLPLHGLVCERPANASGKSWEMIWNNGLYFQTLDKDFTFHTGAVLQYDSAWYSGGTGLQFRPSRSGIGGVGEFLDGTNLRRGRYWFEGTMYQNLDYKFEIEFFNGIGFSPVGTQGDVVASSVVNSPGPTDAWINIKDVPILGNIRVGNQKEWWSLEHLESYRYLQFMERSYLFDFSQMTAFNNGFSPGISAFRTWVNDRIFSAIGFYKNDADLIGFGIGKGEYALTGRLAALPIWQPEDQRYWHVGGAFSHRDPIEDQVLVRIRDDIRNAPFPLLNLLINTGQIPTRSQDLFNIETAFVDGPLTMQAEYTANILRGVSTSLQGARGDGPNLGSYVFQGCYGQVLYFLTGESRPWNNKTFFYNRVVPKKNFAFCKDGFGVTGWGAWELGARYTYVCVTDKTVAAGQLNAATLGLNWYLNPNFKFQFNYDYTYRSNNGDEAANGAIHAFGTRMSLDF